jgi:hypothetical protein
MRPAARSPAAIPARNQTTLACPAGPGTRENQGAGIVVDGGVRCRGGEIGELVTSGDGRQIEFVAQAYIHRKLLGDPPVVLGIEAMIVKNLREVAPGCGLAAVSRAEQEGRERTAADPAGKPVMESILETKASTILEFLGGLDGSLWVTFEEGTSAAWLYDLLKPHVTQVIVCDPRKNALLNAATRMIEVDPRKLMEVMFKPGTDATAICSPTKGLRVTLNVAGSCPSVLNSSLRRAPCKAGPRSTTH